MNKYSLGNFFNFLTMFRKGIKTLNITHWTNNKNYPSNKYISY